MRRASILKSSLLSCSVILTAWLSLAGSASADESASLPSDDLVRCARALDENAQTPAGTYDPSRPTVVLVDGYSSGRLFSQAFRDAGLQVVHVHATGGVPKNFVGSFWPDTYERTIAYSGKVGALARDLRSVNVVSVLPGTDTGVLIADVISSALHRHNPKIRTNGIERARKDKFEMQERIKERGLDSIRQILTADVEQSVQWVRDNNLLSDPSSMVVIKPLSSAGGDGVFFVKSEAEIRRAFRKLLKKTDELGNLNTQVLTQEMITGVEYVANSTIWNGRVLYTDIWEYRKRTTASGRLIYDYDILLPYEGEIQNRLRRYDRKVLKALGITHGNSHSEIKMVEAHLALPSRGRGQRRRGAVLIETNNRPMGSASPALARFATGRSQIDMTALAIANPRAFRATPAAYSIRKNAIAFAIANLYGRNMRLNPAAREKLRRLPGFFQDLLHVEPGRVTKPTEDMFNSVGEVWLLHEDMDLLMRTVDELHAMEQNGELFSEP